jgi:S-adenosylmethionine:tRNA ribosyltransferase-isomerase
MHAEWCRMSTQTRDRIDATRAAGGRVVCVGTTAARTVESVASGLGPGDNSWFATRILITPGHPWRWTDALLTNFHLPRSTLMAMVASFLQHRGSSDGVADLRACYAHAVRQGLRFYSYGDAMLIV